MKSAQFVRVMILALVTTSLLGGCYRITLRNAPTQATTTYREGEWHHDGVLGLVEFSDPVDLKARCGGKTWNSVKVHQTFVQGLVSGVTYGLYNPWDVAYNCK